MKNESINIVPGYYTSKTHLELVVKLSQESRVNKDGSIARTYATWVDKKNILVFDPESKVELTKEMIDGSVALQHLISKGILTRVF